MYGNRKKKKLSDLYRRGLSEIEFIYGLTDVLYMLFAWYYVAIFVLVVSIVMTFMCEVQSSVKACQKTFLHTGRFLRAGKCWLLTTRRKKKKYIYIIYKYIHIQVFCKKKKRNG